MEGFVSGDGTVFHGAVVNTYAAAPLFSGVAGDGAVKHGKVTIIVDKHTAAVFASSTAGDGAIAS